MALEGRHRSRGLMRRPLAASSPLPPRGAPAGLLVSVSFAQDEIATRAGGSHLSKALTGVSHPALIAKVAIIYTSIATSTNSDLPGVAAAKFTAFRRPAFSPNGRWRL